MSIRSDASEQLYREWGNVMFQQTWLGLRAVKNPTDAWLYQEIIYKTKPDIIIETGTYMGGGALFLASLCDIMKHGRVITCETEASNKIHWVEHPRITYFLGSSVSDEFFAKVRGMVKPDDSVLVILDSDHHKEHVAKELKLYSSLIKKGGYLIVEDTWWRQEPDSGTGETGPLPAVQEFLKDNHEFVIDYEKNRYGITNNPNGFLLKH